MTSSARPLLNRRLAEFGTTIFAEMSALARRTGSINLGQGFPDTRRPRGDPGGGRPRAAGRPRQPVPAGPRRPRAAQRRSPPTRSAGTACRTTPTPRSWSPRAPPRPSPPRCSPWWSPATRSIALEPYYDSYAACIAMAGGTRVPVTLRPAPGRRGRGPHRVPPRPRRAARRRHRPDPPAAPQHPAQPHRHGPHPGGARPRSPSWPSSGTCSWSPTRSTSTWSSTTPSTSRSRPSPGMRERTVTIGCAGKTFSFTGWKVGWVTGTARLVDRRPLRQAVPDVRGLRALPVRRRRGPAPARHATSRRSAPTCGPSGTC